MMRTVFDPIWQGTASLDPAQLNLLFAPRHPFVVQASLDYAIVAQLLRSHTATNLPFND
jgi:hypothetical protein